PHGSAAREPGEIREGTRGGSGVRSPQGSQACRGAGEGGPQGRQALSRKGGTPREMGMRSYSVRDVERVLRLSRGTTRGLTNAGFVKPARGARRQDRVAVQARSGRS